MRNRHDLPTISGADNRRMCSSSAYSCAPHNTGELYPDKKRIIALMAHRIAANRYDASEAAKLWRRWLDRGAAMYRKEIPGRRVRFTAALKDALARELADEYEQRILRQEGW